MEHPDRDAAAPGSEPTRMEPLSEVGSDRYQADTHGYSAEEDGPDATADANGSDTDGYRADTEAYLAWEDTPGPLAQTDNPGEPGEPGEDPWWEAQGFATLEEALDEMRRGMDADTRRQRRYSGEELVAARMPENERPLPDPRYGRTLARRYQVNFKLNYLEWSELHWLARECTLPLGTLARMLVLRGTRASRQVFEENDRSAELDP